jgi:hypothetical protein
MDGAFSAGGIDDPAGFESMDRKRISGCRSLSACPGFALGTAVSVLLDRCASWAGSACWADAPCVSNSRAAVAAKIALLHLLRTAASFQIGRLRLGGSAGAEDSLDNTAQMFAVIALQCAS